MELRDFLPGEPVVGDVVLCTDGDFTLQTRAEGRELPEKGRLYKVRSTSEDLHRQWGPHNVIGLTGQDTKGQFTRALTGWFWISQFRATHLPQSDWSKDPHAGVLNDESGVVDPVVKTRHRLWLARQCAAWRQLCYSNLGLAVALAVLPPRDGDDLEAFKESLATTASMRRLDICRLLEFPASSSSLRVLSRLHQSWGQALDTMWLEGFLLAMRQLLNHEPQAADLLLRHETISRKHFKCLAFGSNRIGISDLFLDASEILRGSWFFRLPMARRHWLTAELEAIEKREENAPGLALLPDRRRIGTFQREKDAVVYLLGRQRLLDHLGSTIRDVLSGNGPRPWPEPPLVGSDLIQPITSEKELVEEGKQLRHCVATYADHIAVGVYFAYRMTGPTRCTVGLQWNGKKWTLDQLRGGKNSRIEEEQTAMVQEWIDSHPGDAGVLRSDIAKEVCRLIRLPKRPRIHRAATSHHREPEIH